MMDRERHLDDRIGHIAALANAAVYDDEQTEGYVDGAPHVKHAALRQLYGGMVVEVYDAASRDGRTPKVLDLGAGEGSVTIPFLELGAQVTAVDLSRSQLDALNEKCSKYQDRLDVRCQDVLEALQSRTDTYDIIVANSFLHHVPDYLGLISTAISRLSPSGQFFSFQDPLRYDTVGRHVRLFCAAGYCSWRVFKGDVIGGMMRRLRRSRGVYLDDCAEDNAEYHVVRGGVDHEAIVRLLRENGFDCRLMSYFSTQSRVFQALGSLLGARNTFAVIARRGAHEGIPSNAAGRGILDVQD